MGVIASSRCVCTIRTQHKSVKFFFNFFFSLGVGAWVWARGCGCLGVGAWVWVLGCGRVGGGAWVGRWGRRDGDGRARDEAGWIGLVAVG